MSPPFGKCSNYEIPKALTYYAMSQHECYRKCLSWQFILEWNCIPYVIRTFITEYDLVNYSNICSTKNLQDVVDRMDFENEFKEKCLKICPRECFSVEYSTKVIDIETFFNNQEWVNQFDNKFYERTVLWDTSEPMFAYIDEPVLTFTQYLVYCGGLMSLWFGQSVKDLLTLFINISFWRFFKNIFSSLLNIIEQKIIDLILFMKKIILSIFDSISMFINVISDICKNILMNFERGFSR